MAEGHLSFFFFRVAYRQRRTSLRCSDAPRPFHTPGRTEVGMQDETSSGSVSRELEEVSQELIRHQELSAVDAADR